MRVAVIGATGQLGADISSALSSNGIEVHEIGHDDLDISGGDDVQRVLSDLNSDAVVNTAAYHNVDLCEENPLKAFDVNAVGARNLASSCNALNQFLIHISTDYVFDGQQDIPYNERDLPAPLNVYGNSKLAGEYFVRSMAARSLVMRTSGLYGKNPCRAKGGLNFVQLMLKLGKERDEVRVVDSEILTPTSTIEVARQVVAICENPIYGLCHATAEGSCSWYRFAQKIFEVSHVKTNLNIASPDEFPAKTPRPTFSVLENDVLKKSGLNIFKSWEEGLQEYLRD